MGWQPGDMTAAAMAQAWAQQHGWARQPPESVVAEWQAIARAEAAHARNGAPTTTTAIGSRPPDVLVVPAHPHVDGSPGFAIELATSRQHTVLVGFSTVAGLVQVLGEHQPWVALEAQDLVAVHSGLPIVVDPPPGALDTRWTENRLGAVQEVVSRV